MMDIEDKSIEICENDIEVDLETTMSPYFHESTGIGKLLAFLWDYHLKFEQMMRDSDAFRRNKYYLQDIEYLPMTLIHTWFPMIRYIWISNERDSLERGVGYSRRSPFIAENALKADLENMYYVLMKVTQEKIDRYLSLYAIAKKRDLEMLALAVKLTPDQDLVEWLNECKRLWIHGRQPYSEKAEFDISAYQWYRNIFGTDMISHAAQIKSMHELRMAYEEDILNLRERNDLLQDMLRSSKPECELWFTGLDEIAQLGPFDVSKVSLKLEYEPWEVIDDRKLAKDKYKATKIYISYEGVNDSGECKPLTLYNGPCRIRDEEKKLLIKLAFYQGNAAKLKDILAESKADCVAHLNTMYNTIFNLTGRSNFIDKENGILKVKLDYKRPKSF